MAVGFSYVKWNIPAPAATELQRAHFVPCGGRTCEARQPQAAVKVKPGLQDLFGSFWHICCDGTFRRSWRQSWSSARANLAGSVHHPPLFVQPLVVLYRHQKWDAHTSLVTIAAMRPSEMMYRGFGVRVPTHPATLSHPSVKISGMWAVCQPSGPFTRPGRIYKVNSASVR